MPEARGDTRLLLVSAIVCGAAGLVGLVLAVAREMPALERAGRIAQSVAFLLLAALNLRQRARKTAGATEGAEMPAVVRDPANLVFALAVMVLSLFSLYTLFR